MPTDVALAVLFGALLHATWNTLVKASADKLSLTVLVCCAAALWSLPAVVLLPAPAPESWRFIAQSVLIHLFYFSFVGLAYARVDLSVAYPLMRGLMSLDVNPVPIKTAVSLQGHCSDELRLPLAPMSADNLAALFHLAADGVGVDVQL